MGRRAGTGLSSGCLHCQAANLGPLGWDIGKHVGAHHEQRTGRRDPEGGRGGLWAWRGVIRRVADLQLRQWIREYR